MLRHLSEKSINDGVAATLGEYEVLIRIEFEEDILLI